MLKKQFDSIRTKVNQFFDEDAKTAAESPAQLSLKNWKHVLLETKNALGSKNIGMLAASIAYFATLAFFPLMAASVAIGAMVMSDSQVKDAVAAVQQYLPGDMASLVSSQLQNALKDSAQNTIVAIVAIALALFSVSGAVQNVIKAISISYNTEETRNFILLRLISLGFTVGFIVTIFVSAGLLLINETILRSWHIPEVVILLLPVARWVILTLIVVVGLAILYQFGPDRKNVKWQWVSWGACVSTVLWLVGTALFFVYVQRLANFSNTYSIFAGIIVMMTWLNLSAFIILLGAEINHRLEAKTSKKTRARRLFGV